MRWSLSGRASVLFLVLLLSRAGLASGFAAGCLDYAKYLPELSRLDFTDDASDVAVAGHYAFLAKAGGVLALDVTNPSSPLAVSRMGLPDSPYAIVVLGRLAFVAAGSAGLQILELSNPASMRRVGGVVFPGGARGVRLAGTLAYVATTGSLQVIDVSDPASPRILGSVNLGYGRGSVAVLGDYAYVAGAESLEVVDVSNPASPRRGTNVGVHGYSQAVAIRGSYLFVATSGSYSEPGTLSIFDLAEPASPAVTASVEADGAALNIMLAGDRAFVVTAQAGIEGYFDFGLQVFDVSDVAHPTSLASLRLDADASSVYVTGGYAYVAEAGCNGFSDSCNRPGGFRILDVSGLASPLPIGTATLPGQPGGIFAREGMAYVTVYGRGLQIFDVADATSPRRVGQLSLRTGPVVVESERAYVASTGGLEIADVSNPTAPARLGAVATRGWSRALGASGHFACVIDSAGILDFIDASDPTLPLLVGRIGVPGEGSEVALRDRHAFVACGGGFVVVDFSNPASPAIVATLNGRPVRQLALEGNRVGLLDASGELTLVDVAVPTQPTRLGSISLPFTLGGSDLAMRGGFCYLLGEFSSRLCVVDVRDPTAPSITGRADVGLYAQNLAVDTGRVYIPGISFPTGSDRLLVLPEQCGAVTPVTVSDFQATPTPSAILLTWRTARESESARFRVLRSASAREGYAPLGEIVGGSSPYAFRDASAQPGTTYFYELEVMDSAGQRYDFGPVSARLAARFDLAQNHPNPFNPGTEIRFDLGHARRATLRIFDATGRRVRTLLDRRLEVGPNGAFWDGRDDRGREVPGGVYLYRLDAGGFSASKKLLLIR